MLNERIEKYSEVADIEGLYFVWQNLIAGVTSIETLTHMRSHHSGKLCVNILPAVLLFEEMGLVSLNNNIISLSDINSFNDPEAFAEWFSPQLLDFLLKENVLSFENVTYDDNLDKFVLGRNCIKYRYAAYRNLLLSFRLLSRRDDGNYYIENADDSIVSVVPQKQKKKSLDNLLKELEAQREQGLAGEIFVLEYEKKRLDNHPMMKKIKQISSIDVSAGYDIISFDSLSSTSLDRFIEVKTYKSKPHFHWSDNEMRIARIRKERYFIYLVDYEKIGLDGYEPIIINDPIAYFKNNDNWNITPDSYLFEFID